MNLVGAFDFVSYREYLENCPGEFTKLFNTVLINVTKFFRDRIPWEFMSAEVIPRILARKAEDDPIRVWSAGCATGEEAFTLAMVLSEALGAAEFEHG